jgi:hypothetical protein
MVSVGLFDPLGNPVKNVRSGAPVHIVVEIHTKFSNAKPEDFWLDMTFKDSLSHPVACVSTRFMPPANCSDNLNTSFALCCQIPQLLLVEDNYALDLWLSYRRGECDFVQRAMEVQVTAGDFFGTGRVPVKRWHGSGLMPHQWFLCDGAAVR